MKFLVFGPCPLGLPEPLTAAQYSPSHNCHYYYYYYYYCCHCLIAVTIIIVLSIIVSIAIIAVTLLLVMMAVMIVMIFLDSGSRRGASFRACTTADSSFPWPDRELRISPAVARASSRQEACFLEFVSRDMKPM